MPDKKPAGSTPAELIEFMPALEAARERKITNSSRLLVYALCLGFFLLLIWAAFADLEETVSGQGQVVPSQRIQHIQHLEGGILREILVREGQEVQKDAPLLRMDDLEAGSKYRDYAARSRELAASAARLTAELEDADPEYPENLRQAAPEIVERHNQLLQARRDRLENERKALAAQLELKKLEEQELTARRQSVSESLDIARKQLEMAKKLTATRSYSEMEYLNLQQNVTQLSGEMKVLDSGIPKTRAAIREAEEKLRVHKSAADAAVLQELNAASAELAALKENLAASGDRVTRTEVRSPVHGVVKSININTSGAVIMPGQIIMDVVPKDDSLVIEAHIRPQDRAFLFVGQKARIRLSAYDFSIYGALPAELEHISADTIEGRQGEVHYLVRLRTERSSLEHSGRELPILPGMMGTADIITGKRTVLDYLLKPLLKARQEAMREP